MEQRACDLALYVIESRGTVRSAAKKFGISKSTVHKDLSERLPALSIPSVIRIRIVIFSFDDTFCCRNVAICPVFRTCVPRDGRYA